MNENALEEVLAFREKRARAREGILAKHRVPLAVLGLNIPGAGKDFPWARRAFHEEVEAFRLALEARAMKVLYEKLEMESSGYTAFISVDTKPEHLKSLALDMEASHLLGRLFDADVYGPDGKKLSRADFGLAPRFCFICGKDGFVCARSRAHSGEELRGKILKMIENWLRRKLSDRIISSAIWAMMSEAAISPKPGLVNTASSGSRRGMDFFTLIDSAAEMLPWFRDCALAGFDLGAGGASLGAGESGAAWLGGAFFTAGLSGNPSAAKLPGGARELALFESLRRKGMAAEILMRKASGGVNTHRGYIFSLGILSAAYGNIFRRDERPNLAEITGFAKAMTASLGKDFSRRRAGNVSHGEAVHAQTGIQGARGEALRGFPSLREHALPLLRRMLNEGRSLNDAGIAVLLKLMAHAEDTDLIYRGGEGVFRALRKNLRAFFMEDSGSPEIPGVEAVREKAAILDREFIAKNLSPGGSADLLGAALFLHRLLDG